MIVISIIKVRNNKMIILNSHISTGQENSNAAHIKYIVIHPKINRNITDRIKPPLIADLSPLLIERCFFKDIIETQNCTTTTINKYVIQPQYKLGSFIVSVVIIMKMSQVPTKIVFKKRSILKNNHNLDNFIINLGLSSNFPLYSLWNINLLNVINIFGGLLLFPYKTNEKY